ncbi:MAG: TonB-dependent receptor, partial [Candidatus Aminicenantes bacterium]|nr:TonB-dependent receptor [Candidatus Aminicenantes bacterium]
ELKFGAEYKTSTIDSASGNGNGLQARLRNGVPYEVRMYNSFGQKFAADRVSGYVQDTIGFGRLNLNLGLRYDRQTGGILDYTNTPTNVDAVRNVGGVNYNWGTVTQTAADFPFTWNMISPRIGFTYDLFGNGKTILKGGFSVYGSQFDATAAWTMWFVYDYHRFRWADANGDKTPQGGELTYLSTLGLSDLAASTAEQIGDYFSSSLTPEKTAEAVFSLEHELKADFAVGMSFQYRKMYDFNWQHLLVLDYATDETRPVRHSDWVESGAIDGIPYWDIDWDHVESTYTDVFTKRPDYYERYWGLEFNFKKRLSHRWMLDGSFTYQDHKVFFPTTDSYQDPTNHLPIDRLNGQPMAYQAAGSGSSDVYLNSRWIFKLAGIYELPYGINFSGTLTGREGFIAPLYAVDYDWYNWDDEYPAVWLEDFGATRDPAVFLLNLRLEKKFRFADRVNLYLTADGFNMFNSNVQLARNRNKSADNYGQTLCIMSPRIFRFGARLEF